MDGRSAGAASSESSPKDKSSETAGGALLVVAEKEAALKGDPAALNRSLEGAEALAGGSMAK